MIRRQVSLFLRDRIDIESLRLRYNPIQAQLIPPHVTLCREDELTDWDTIRSRLETLCPFEITLEFGAPVREDHFVYLPVREGQDDFHAFRCAILDEGARRQTPHLTLIHPRNGTCTDEIFAELSESISPFQYTFCEAMFIEQVDGGVWKVIAQVGTSRGRCSC